MMPHALETRPAHVIGSPSIDVAGLENELRRSVRGEVRFDDGSRALYATDASNYRQVPIGVVIPRDNADVIQTMAACRRYGAPILGRGGGTSLAGQCCNVAVVLDFSKYMNRILDLQPEQKRARVQPGVILDDLMHAAEKHHLTFAPDPSTHNHCTMGGMIGNNACGVHSVMGGKTDDNVEQLDILLYEGLRLRVGKTSDEEFDRIIAAGGRRAEIYTQLRSLRDRYADQIREKFPRIPRRVSGFPLNWLLPENGFDVAKALVGTEGTCVTVLEATVRLIDSPPVRSLLVLGYESVYSAADHISEIMSYGPTGVEGIDDRLVEDMTRMNIHPRGVRLLPDGGGWLMVEFGGESAEESEGKARKLMEDLERQPSPPSMKLFDDPEQVALLWQVRESGLGATAHVPGEPITWEGWEDSAVAPDDLGNYLRDFRALLQSYGFECDFYGHFGQGCVHTRIDFDLYTAEGIKNYRSFINDAADLVVSYGGSFSGEHGDGQSRGELLPKLYGPELVEAFNEFKAIWDPAGKMNPGKVVTPYRLDENLRLGTDYQPRHVETHFQWPDDAGDFGRAALRCVGIGECRRMEGGTMCPSFRVTKEEMHSTRGRAHLLFEMLVGNPVKEGWRSEHIHEALDLCLSCKGCKGDCPINVDVATYKAEFLSHYYAGRLRPRQAYTMGLIPWWAWLASYMPNVANFFSQTPVLGNISKWIGGIAQQREMPRFAQQTFKQWFRQRGERNVGQSQVILWPDTFNNYFRPDIAQAATEVLEAAGFHVLVPQARLCCGRPLYDYGMLDLAKKLLVQILDELRPQIQAGVPVVGLEPSCVAVFRDELTNLFPHDKDAQRLKQQTYFWNEFFSERAEDFSLPQLERKAIVHGHCHHKALVKRIPHERKVLEALGLDMEVLDSGCCGMAGSFGFEDKHYDVSVAVGEHELLPTVRATDEETLIIADGFSCQEQIHQLTDRRALHSAEVMHMALRQGAPQEPRHEEIERQAAERNRRRRTAVALAAGAGTVLVGGWIIRSLSASNGRAVLSKTGLIR